MAGRTHALISIGGLRVLLCYYGSSIRVSLRRSTVIDVASASAYACHTGKEFQGIHKERVQSVEGRIFDLFHQKGEEGAKIQFASMDGDRNGKVTFNEFKDFLEM